MKSAVVFFCSILLLTASIAAAQEFKTLTAEELKERIKREDILVVDTRTDQEYMSGHLPTAINIPPPQFRFIENKLPADKGLPVAFYCRGYS